MQQTIRQLQQRMQHAMELQLQALKNKLGRQAEVLNAVSPLNTLGRGYAIVTNDKGQAIRNSQQVKKGETLYTQLHQGKLSCSVTDVYED